MSQLASSLGPGDGASHGLRVRLKRADRAVVPREHAHHVRGQGDGPYGQDRGPEGRREEHRDALSCPCHPPRPTRHTTLKVHRDGLWCPDDQLLHHLQEEEGGGSGEGAAQDARVRRGHNDRLWRLSGPPVWSGRHDTQRHRGVPVRGRFRPGRDARQADGLHALRAVRT